MKISLSGFEHQIDETILKRGLDYYGKGKSNSIAQFGCKIRVNPGLWDATSQRCTGMCGSSQVADRRIDLRSASADFNSLGF